MKMKMRPALHSAALLLLLLLPATPTKSKAAVPIQVEVRNSLTGASPLAFSTEVAGGGILLGALNRLMASNQDFKFTYTEDPNYGLFLESVNGLAGNSKDHTYWELLVQIANGTIIKPNVGIGCFLPSINEIIILNFTTWE